MAGLAETTARLKRLRRGAPDDAERQMAEIAAVGPNPGELRMLAYRPASAEGPLPLVVVLHGCTQRGEAFARQAGWLTLADRCGFVVVAAEQSTANNPNRCFNWYEPQDIGRDQGEAASIAAMVAHAVRTQGVDPTRVFVTGLSAGGAMAAVMLATYPDLFAAGAVVAGLPYGVAQGVASAFGTMQGGGVHGASALGDLVRSASPHGGARPRLAIWHGDADYTVRSQNACDLASQWTDFHGLADSDATWEDLAHWTRTTWRAPGSETPTIELNLARGLGHGVPLATSGPAGLGSVAPFMLEAGISSSLEIARFWGLADDMVLSPGSGAEGPNPRSSSLHQLGDQVMSHVAPHVSPAIQAVIAKALKGAGLRR